MASEELRKKIADKIVSEMPETIPKNGETNVFLVGIGTGGDSIDARVIPQIKGPDAYQMDHAKYLQKLAGTENVPPTAVEIAEKESAELSLLPDETFAEVIQEHNRIKYESRHPKTRFSDLGIQWEIARREKKVMSSFIKGNKNELIIKKDACCDGTMLEFRDDVTICIPPERFTQIKELVGDTICAEKPTSFPKKLTVIQGDGEALTFENEIADYLKRRQTKSQAGGMKVYYSRDVIPYWMRLFLDAEADDAPETRDVRKVMWDQMLVSVTKKKNRKTFDFLGLHVDEDRFRSKLNKQEKKLKKKRTS